MSDIPLRAGHGQPQLRARAARILAEIVGSGKTLDQTFGIDADTPPLLTELVYGSLRYYHCLAPLADRHLARPLRNKDLDVYCLLIVGAYQLHYMRTPAHAAVAETVSGCRALKKHWATGLVNAILRKIGNDTPDERTFGLDQWWWDALRAAYPEEAETLARGLLERAPMSLRVNRLRTDADAVRALLADAGVVARQGLVEEQLILDSPVPVRTLPGYADGLFSVQDGGAQMAAQLIAAEKPEGPVLDACAAPGGKLFHIAERCPEVLTVGIELSAPRFEHLLREARRLGHEQVILRRGDAARADWEQPDDPDAYEVILLDAPCTGSGTLRRHPDIRVLRSEDDPPAQARRQRQLLTALWQRLKPGGTLIYCTCSIFPEENDGVVGDFLASTPDAVSKPLKLPLGRPTTHGWQLLTLPAPTTPPNLTVDGFYYARLTRCR